MVKMLSATSLITTQFANVWSILSETHLLDVSYFLFKLLFFINNSNFIIIPSVELPFLLRGVGGLWVGFTGYTTYFFSLSMCANSGIQ